MTISLFIIAPGTIVHVKNYKEFDNQTDLYFDIARHGLDPCKIQYGLDPKSFILEFHEKLQPQGIVSHWHLQNMTLSITLSTLSFILTLQYRHVAFDIFTFFTFIV